MIHVPQAKGIPAQDFSTAPSAPFDFIVQGSVMPVLAADCVHSQRSQTVTTHKSQECFTIYKKTLYLILF